MRFAIASVMVALAACGSARIGDPPDPGDPDGSTDDPPDAGGPVRPDARVCVAGDQRIIDPQTGHCIAYFAALATWLEARAACIVLDGDLAAPTSMQENDLMWPIATNVLAEPDAWIGGTDVGSEGNFTWVTTETFSYTHFRAGEPNNGGTDGVEEDCLVIEDDSLGTWDDRPCLRDYPYFCDIP